jgi:putative transposase
MAKTKRHSRVEIATKLARANDLATQGKLQSEIARRLGVSVMTLHPVAQSLAGASARIDGDRRGERARSHARHRPNC